MRALAHRLGRWFFQRGDPRVAASLRIAFCAVYLFMLWDFHPVMPLLFGHGGLFGTMEPFPFELRGPQYLLFHHDSHAALEVWFWSSVAVCTLGLVGCASRVSVVLTYLSMALFRERDPFMTFGADLVMNCIGLWLMFLDTGRTWSVDAVLLRGRARRTLGDGRVELWPARAIQIQIALVYLVTGLKKLQTPPWQDGSAVYYALQVGNVMKGHAPPWILDHHAALAFLNYATLFIEIGAPFMLFFRPLRAWAFLLCVLMHTGIDLLMSIRFFSLAMYVGFLAFLDAADWDRCIAGFRKCAAYVGLPVRPRQPVPNLVPLLEEARAQLRRRETAAVVRSEPAVTAPRHRIVDPVAQRPRHQPEKDGTDAPRTAEGAQGADDGR